MTFTVCFLSVCVATFSTKYFLTTVKASRTRIMPIIKAINGVAILKSKFSVPTSLSTKRPKMTAGKLVRTPVMSMRKEAKTRAFFSGFSKSRKVRLNPFIISENSLFIVILLLSTLLVGNIFHNKLSLGDLARKKFQIPLRIFPVRENGLSCHTCIDDARALADFFVLIFDSVYNSGTILAEVNSFCDRMLIHL